MPVSNVIDDDSSSSVTVQDDNASMLHTCILYCVHVYCVCVLLYSSALLTNYIMYS